ncbi:MAG: ABA4-like family protein [Pseudomonadota bacterium]
MNPDTVFTVANISVIPAWLLLAILPQHAITQRVVHTLWIPCLLACFYGWALFFGEPAAEGAGFGSLEALSLLFQSKTALLAGWIHYLAFDLFIGAWQVRDAARRGINHWLVVPCLFFTLMAGPMGLLLYLLLRLVLNRVTTLSEA